MSGVIVKVCGVTRPEDAALAVELGADLIGVNFHPPSPRALDPAADGARLLEIADAVASAGDGGHRALLVGVFVHRPPAEIEEIAESARLDLVQLHGDPTAAEAARFGERAIRVFRTTGAAALDAAADEIERHPPVWGYLFDTPPGAYRAASEADPFGGTGESWDHGAVRRVVARTELPVLIAGGLRPGNARAALAASGARGIDVCSGVESAPGVKDADLTRRLFEEIRDGDAADP